MSVPGIHRVPFRCGLAVLLATCLLLPAATRAEADEPLHPHAMPPLDLETNFPRLTPEQLENSGYPDHCHAYAWPDWRPLTDGRGGAYGPGTLCIGRRTANLPGLVVEPGHIRWECFDLRFATGYEACDMMSFIEWCDVGRIRCRDLLELEADTTLALTNPDNVAAYTERTGFGTWRHYLLEGDAAVLQPIPLLRGRTLEGHAGIELAVEWVLDHCLGERIPAWRRVGLATYLAEDGVHLNNYMAQFRAEGIEVLLPPRRIDEILDGPPDPADHTDRRLFRQASYSAFLMVWHLVEDRGGLDPVRRLLAAVRGGESLAAACQVVYGTALADLESQLEPLASGEPIGGGIQPRRPHLPPVIQE